MIAAMGLENEESLDLSAELPDDLRSAALRLASLLSHAELEGLLGRDLVNGFRSLARTALGKNPKLSKESIAGALIIQFGTELFSDKARRSIVANKLNVDFPKRWFPGGYAAVKFAVSTGFDEIFGGTSSDSKPDDVEWIAGRVTLAPLEDFQREVLEKCQSTLTSHRAHPRLIVTLPTGGGKTRVATEYAAWLLNKHAEEHSSPIVLWVAHTEELLEQAASAVRQVWNEVPAATLLRLDRRFGSYGKNASDDEEFLGGHQNPQIVLATPQRLLNDLARWAQNSFKSARGWIDRIQLIVIDEAHRAAAPQYKKLIEFFEGRSKATGSAEPRILGLTATPFRNEYLNSFPELGTRELYKIFRRFEEPNETLGTSPRETLQRRSILARPVEHRIDTNKSLKVSDIIAGSEGFDSPASMLEAVDRRLMELADKATRRTIVFKHLLEVCAAPGSRILYFGPSVTDAAIIAFMLRASGIAASFVSGASRRAERRRVINEFRNGSSQILCNCEVLTTGFDAPLVTHVVIARPTVSHVLFEQMVGRGLRGPRFGGTAECHVTYFVDNMDVEHPRLGYQAWRAIWEPRAIF